MKVNRLTIPCFGFCKIGKNMKIRAKIIVVVRGVPNFTTVRAIG